MSKLILCVEIRQEDFGEPQHFPPTPFGTRWASPTCESVAFMTIGRYQRLLPWISVPLPATQLPSRRLLLTTSEPCGEAFVRRRRISLFFRKEGPPRKCHHHGPSIYYVHVYDRGGSGE